MLRSRAQFTWWHRTPPLSTVAGDPALRDPSPSRPGCQPAGRTPRREPLRFRHRVAERGRSPVADQALRPAAPGPRPVRGPAHRRRRRQVVPLRGRRQRPRRHRRLRRQGRPRLDRRREHHRDRGRGSAGARVLACRARRGRRRARPQGGAARAHREELGPRAPRRATRRRLLEPAPAGRDDAVRGLRRAGRLADPLLTPAGRDLRAHRPDRGDVRPAAALGAADPPGTACRSHRRWCAGASSATRMPTSPGGSRRTSAVVRPEDRRQAGQRRALRQRLRARDAPEQAEQAGAVPLLGRAGIRHAARSPTATTGWTWRRPTSAATPPAAISSSTSSTRRETSDAADPARRPRPDHPLSPALAVLSHARLHGSLPGLGRQDRPRGGDRPAERLGPRAPSAPAPARDLTPRAQQLRLGERGPLLAGPTRRRPVRARLPGRAQPRP